MLVGIVATLGLGLGLGLGLVLAEVPGSGSGLVKIIWRHGEESKKPVAERVTREDVMALPNVVRELQAESGAKEANRMWVRQRDDGEHVVYIDGPTSDGRRVLSIFVAKNKAEYSLSARLDGSGSPGRLASSTGDTAREASPRSSESQIAGSPGRVRSPAGDTAREPLGRLPESRDGNMPPQARAVNFAKAAPEPAALPEPDARPARKADDPRTATLIADKGFVKLDDAASATHRSQPAGTHGFANAVDQEARGLVGDLQHAMQLVRAETLLARRSKVNRLQ